MPKTAELSLPDAALRDAIKTMPKLVLAGDPGAATHYDINKVSPLTQTLFNYGGLLPIGATAAALWYANRQAKEPEPPVEKKRKKTPLVKTADLKQILENIRYHLPAIDPRDTGIGLVGGAGAGLLWDLIRGKGKDGKSHRLRRVLTGALTGAGVSNLAGDRLRRYVSNKVMPQDYTNDKLKELIPGTRFSGDDVNNRQSSWEFRRALQDIYRGAIQDKQIYEGKSNKTQARRELVRRSFGLPTGNADPYWQKNQDGTYSLNEKSPEYATRLRRLFGPVGDEVRGTSKYNNTQRKVWGDEFPGHLALLKDPVKTLHTINKYPGKEENEQNGWQPSFSREFDMFGMKQLVGNTQLPFKTLPNGDVAGQVLDRWDLTPSQIETNVLRNGVKSLRTGGFRGLKEWAGKPLPHTIGEYMDPESHTNAQAAATIAGRWGWDNLLAKELPWVKQDFMLKKMPNRTWGEFWANTPDQNAVRDASPHQLQYLKNDQTPATPSMDAAALRQWIQNL